MITRHLTIFLALALLMASCQSPEAPEPTAPPEPAESTEASALEPSPEPAPTETQMAEAETESTDAATDEGESDAAPMPVELDCRTSDMSSLDAVACNVIASLETQNTQPLMGYMSDPFGMLYWRSEGVSTTRENALAEIETARLPDSPTTPPVFSTDPATLPSMMDVAPSSWLGPDVELDLTLFSTGWGPEGADEAMLFFTRDEAGEFKWSHLFYAPGGFER